MTEDIQSFLASTLVFQDVLPEQLANIVPLFKSRRFPSGTIILRQGARSAAVYFLRSGQLAVRVQRGELRETVAYLEPPEVFGELSFITSSPCVADVEVTVDSEVLILSSEDLPQLPRERDAVLRGLVRVVAERLQRTVTRGTKAPELPVVLLRNHPHWEAPLSFGVELARSLARQTGRETLVVNLGSEKNSEMRTLDEHAAMSDISVKPGDESLRGELAEQLTHWKARFSNIILNPVGSGAEAACGTLYELCNWMGELFGPGDPVPEELPSSGFVVQSAVQPTLPFLNGSRQLIYEANESEAAHRLGEPVSARFRRTVDSVARAIAGLQVGIALGGGAAWGWSHIGALSVFEKAGLPIDMISGCSMGSVIGAFRSAGYGINELTEVADYWRTRTRRFIEWRFWRMCLVNEKAVNRTFHGYFGDRLVNQTEIPFWANAVDIQTGKEVAIRDGTLVDCVRASIALPGLLPPYSSNSYLLVDAGVMDPVPAVLVRSMGCHFAIAINAMAPPESRKVRTRYPMNAFDIMTRCMFVMGHEIGEARALAAADMVFTPPLGGISMLDFSRSLEIIQRGQNAAEDHLPAILEGYEALRHRMAKT